MASTGKRNLTVQTALAANHTGDKVNLDDRDVDLIGWIKADNVHASTTIAAKIEHSADNDVWVDLVSFTNIVGAAGQEAKSIDKALPYVRSSITLSGATKLADVTIDLFYGTRR